MLSMDALRDVRAIGYNISKMMDNKEMSAADLAAQLSCPEIQVLTILKGSGEIKQSELEAIAQVLEVPVSRILEEPDSGIMDYNIHYMGSASNAEAMNRILDDVDLYVRLLNS